MADETKPEVILEARSEAAIRAEEKIRCEVRQQVDSNGRSGIWKLVNEPFSLWLLSTILVGSLTFTYTKSAAYFKQRADQAARLDRLDTQISARVEFAQKLRQQSSQREILNILLHDTEQTRIDMDFRERSTLSLGWEDLRLRKIMGQSSPHDEDAQTLIAELVADEFALNSPDSHMSAEAKAKLVQEIEKKIDKLDSL